MIEPWTKLKSELMADCRVFKVSREQRQSPRTGEAHDFFVINSVHWVNVIAVTEDDHLVMVEQYRHGSETVELEVPGGMMDAEDASPIVAGTRELREETGYEGGQAELIGRIFPNPAIMSNVCHTLLVRNCRALHNTAFDHSEDIVTRLVPVREIPELMRGGRIQHALVAVALYHFDLWRRQRGL